MFTTISSSNSLQCIPSNQPSVGYNDRDKNKLEISKPSNTACKGNEFEKSNDCDNKKQSGSPLTSVKEMCDGVKKAVVSLFVAPPVDAAAYGGSIAAPAPLASAGYGGGVTTVGSGMAANNCPLSTNGPKGGDFGKICGEDKREGGELGEKKGDRFEVKGLGKSEEKCKEPKSVMPMPLVVPTVPVSAGYGGSIAPAPVVSASYGGSITPKPSVKPACNQGIGNGSEGCDPGKSQPRGGSNDEGGRKPGEKPFK
jgi:hypothetical protein